MLKNCQDRSRLKRQKLKNSQKSSNLSSSTTKNGKKGKLWYQFKNCLEIGTKSVSKLLNLETCDIRFLDITAVLVEVNL